MRTEVLPDESKRDLWFTETETGMGQYILGLCAEERMSGSSCFKSALSKRNLFRENTTYPLQGTGRQEKTRSLQQ